MIKEQRNYYRLLHVQPEAPVEIITASYRSIMTKMRFHPDLGGNNETAALINKAYAVLKDPEKRKAYDRTLNGMQHKPSARQQAPSSGTKYADNASSNRAYLCPFCSNANVAAVVTANSRCNRCESPLAPIPNRFPGKREILGQRFSARVAKADTAKIFPGWGFPAVSARLRDLSPIGISLFAATNLAPGAVVRVVSPSYDFLARVVRVRPMDRIQIVHARLITAWFVKKSSVFVSMSV
jgi:curved DNA-binding protein CbpA